MYDERIDQHAGFLETLGQRQFNMGIVACIGPKVECVSAGCAMGWTPNTFPELVRWAYTPEEVRAWRRVASENKRNSFAVSVQWRDDPGVIDHEAMRLLFDITDREVGVLFGTGYNGYQTPKEVARGLRYFAKTRVLPNTDEYMDMLRKEHKLAQRRVRAKEVVHG